MKAGVNRKARPVDRHQVGAQQQRDRRRRADLGQSQHRQHQQGGAAGGQPARTVPVEQAADHRPQQTHQQPTRQQQHARLQRVQSTHVLEVDGQQDDRPEQRDGGDAEQRDATAEHGELERPQVQQRTLAVDQCSLSEHEQHQADDADRQGDGRHPGRGTAGLAEAAQAEDDAAEGGHGQSDRRTGRAAGRRRR